MRYILAISSIFLVLGISALYVCIKEDLDSPSSYDSNLLLLIMSVTMILYAVIFYILVAIRTIEISNSLRREKIENKKEETDVLIAAQKRILMSKNYII